MIKFIIYDPDAKAYITFFLFKILCRSGVRGFNFPNKTREMKPDI